MNVPSGLRSAWPPLVLDLSSNVSHFWCEAWKYAHFSTVRGMATLGTELLGDV